MGIQRILHADSNTLFRNTLIHALGTANANSDADELKIVQSLANGAEVVKACASENFDLLILDTDMAEMTGYEAAKVVLLQHPKQKILILSAHETASTLRKSIDIGVCGHISKECTLAELMHAIETVLAGKKFFNQDILLKLIDQGRDGDKSNVLTKRELTMLQLICNEKTSKEMARALNVTVRTVDGYLRILSEKLGVRTKIGLAGYAFRNGLF